MARNSAFEMGLPPFRGAVRQIIIASIAIYVVILLLMAFAQPIGQTVLTLGILDPEKSHTIRYEQRSLLAKLPELSLPVRFRIAKRVARRPVRPACQRWRCSRRH